MRLRSGHEFVLSPYGVVRHGGAKHYADGGVQFYPFVHLCPGIGCAVNAWLHWKHLRSLGLNPHLLKDMARGESSYEVEAKA